MIREKIFEFKELNLQVQHNSSSFPYFVSSIRHQKINEYGIIYFY